MPEVENANGFGRFYVIRQSVPYIGLYIYIYIYIMGVYAANVDLSQFDIQENRTITKLYTVTLVHRLK